MSGFTLDAGALIAHERHSRFVDLVLERARERDETVSVPAGVVAQVWRGGPRHARLARLLWDRTVEIVDLDASEARAAGRLCGRTDTSDVIDASVVVCAISRGAAILTSDPDDLRRLHPSIELIVV